MKKTQYKIMFRFIKNIFIGLLGACTKESFREPLTSNFKQSTISDTHHHFSI